MNSSYRPYHGGYLSNFVPRNPESLVNLPDPRNCMPDIEPITLEDVVSVSKDYILRGDGEAVIDIADSQKLVEVDVFSAEINRALLTYGVDADQMKILQQIEAVCVIRILDVKDILLATIEYDKELAVDIYANQTVASRYVLDRYMRADAPSGVLDFLRAMCAQR